MIGWLAAVKHMVGDVYILVIVVLEEKMVLMKLISG